MASTAGRRIERRQRQAEAPTTLILMDMQMPRMDGLGADAGDPRKSPPPRRPILAMTANAFSEDRDRCIAAGMDDFIAKPVEPALLYAALHRWLTSGRSASPGRPVRCRSTARGLFSRSCEEIGHFPA